MCSNVLVDDYNFIGVMCSNFIELLCDTGLHIPVDVSSYTNCEFPMALKRERDSKLYTV